MDDFLKFDTRHCRKNSLDSKDNTKPFPLPATLLGVDNGNKAFKYIKSTRNPTVTIFKSVKAVEKRTSYVVSFASRGPNSITPEILKVISARIRDSVKSSDSPPEVSFTSNGNMELPFGTFHQVETGNLSTMKRSSR
ncbi:hypothetical protein ACET3Z_022683 [Daucus carota]